MTNTDGTSPATPARSKKNATATEPATAVAGPAAPATRGIGRGILIGAIAASLVGGLVLGGGAGALIATAVAHDGRPGMNQAGPGGQVPGGQLGQGQSGGPGQGQQGQGGPGHGGAGQGQQGPGQNGGGMPAQPPQGTPGQTQGGSSSTDGSD